MGGGLFAAREINNGFAVVSTDGVPDVPVKLQNNLIGRSDDRGLLLVTPLNSYQKNLISIDPMDLPANMRIARVEANATPADRSGALVSFGITPYAPRRSFSSTIRVSQFLKAAWLTPSTEKDSRLSLVLMG